MLDFKQKNTLRKFLYAPITVGILVLLALYALYSTWSIYEKMAQSRQDMEKSQKELLALAAKNNQLDSDIGQLQTQSGVEKEIRSKFGIAKPNESMAVIVPDSNSSSTTTTTYKSLWLKFLGFFGL